MEVTNHISYNIDASSKRMDDIINSGNGNFSDTNSLPNRNALTYTNGFYVNIAALFIDIADSSDMTDEHKRPVLAKIYRSFISECTAIMNENINCKEININGDCVWGVFDTPYKSDIDDVFSVAAKLHCLMDILNYKLNKKGYQTIKAGIGMDYGRALMVKAGYSGSGLNDIIWMGDVVNSACHLSGEAGRNGKKVIIASSTFYQNLNEQNQKLFERFSSEWVTKYQSNAVNIRMNDWYKENCK